MPSKSLVGLACCALVATVSARSAADTDTQVHLGLESSIYSSTSIDGSTSVNTSSGFTTDADVNRTISEFGFPGSTSLSLGALLSDLFDLGMRFGYSSHKTEYGANQGSLEVSGFEFSPYLALVPGSERDDVRVGIGIIGGLGSASVTVTPASTTSSTTSSSSESSADTKSYGGFVRLYGFVGDSASIDPAISVMSTHASASGVDLSGVTCTLSIGISVWPSRTAPAPAAERPKHRSKPEGSDASRPPQQATEAASVVAKPRPGIVTLKFGQERTITFMRDTKSEKPAVFVLVRDPAQQDTLSVCDKLTFHAANEEDEAIQASWGTASSQAMRFQVLKASVGVETLRRMVAAPIANNASIAEHWIDVCSQRWKISEAERARLKEFVADLPRDSSTSPPVATVPESTPE